jgi:hypothetical protein
LLLGNWLYLTFYTLSVFALIKLSTALSGIKMRSFIVPVFLGLASLTSAASLDGSTTKREDPTVFGFPSASSYTQTLPVFTLGEQVVFPPKVLQQILTPHAPETALNETSAKGAQVVFDGKRVAAFRDPSTGETSVFPKLESLTPAATHNISVEHASEYVRDSQIFPADDSHFALVQGSTLYGSRNGSGISTSPAVYLTDLQVQRNITANNRVYPVCGPGTKGVFSYSPDGTLQALNHRWRPAKKSNIVTVRPISGEQVTRNIAAGLSAANLSHAAVQRVDICYYDSGNNYIQPVYRYFATFEGVRGSTNETVLGYIAAGAQAVEPLPTLNPHSSESGPTTPKTIRPRPQDVTSTNNTSTNNTATAPPTKRQIAGLTTGRYAMWNDGLSTVILQNTADFWAGLSGSGGSFINYEYTYTIDSYYESIKNSHTNLVDIAYTVGHGNIHQFDADSNEAFVTMAEIGATGGLGPGAGGNLDYWLIKACDVIPTITQYINRDGESAVHNVWDDWWGVFDGGLHVVAGYSTEAFAVDSDGTETTIGRLIGQGTSVVWSWLNTINTSSMYNNPSRPYTNDPNWPGTQYYGKPATIFPCGQSDDTVFDRQVLGRPTQLCMLWY